MTINHDSQWHEVPTQADKDELDALRDARRVEEKRATYWNKERLEKFWGNNPTQEFNDRIETQDDIQMEFQEALGGAEQKKAKSLAEMDVYENRFGSAPKKMIRRFASGAVRSDDTGRIRPDYLSPYGLAEIAEHFTVAKNDFGPTNYFRGIHPHEILPSVMRHMLEFQEGVMKGDRDMIRTALRSLGANAIMGLHQMVLEDKGEYVEVYDKTELVDANEYLKELEEVEYAKMKEKQRKDIVKMMRGDEELGL